jgi:hypothetical protein
MKNFIYTVGLLLLITSCRTIEKLVEQGRYDDAIILATEKLAGKKHKKTKHVVALEEAFARITQRDMDDISRLNNDVRSKNWDRVYDIAEIIERRQRRIEPFLPLISKEGYEAQFDFVRTDIIKNEALTNAAEFHYSRGITSTELFESTADKKHIRDAYSSFIEADKRIDNYKNTQKLIVDANKKGIVKIYVDVKSSTDAIIPQELDQEMREISLAGMNTLWKEFYTKESAEVEYDYTATLQLDNIELSPERETINTHTDTKKVKDGWKYKKNKDGTFARDTSDKKIKVDKYKTVSATVIEIHREKAAIVTGTLEYLDSNSGELVKVKTISAENVFIDYASKYKGDKRALCVHDHKRLKERPLPFPEDYYMIIDTAEDLKSNFRSNLRALPI